MGLLVVWRHDVHKVMMNLIKHGGLGDKPTGVEGIPPQGIYERGHRSGSKVSKDKSCSRTLYLLESVR